jgi:hypothetical protein
MVVSSSCKLVALKPANTVFLLGVPQATTRKVAEGSRSAALAEFVVALEFSSIARYGSCGH